MFATPRIPSSLVGTLIVLLAAACGDDSTLGTGGAGGAGSTASTTSTAAATTTASSTTAGSTTTASGTGGGDGSGGGAGGGSPAACLTAEAVDVLQAHLDEMSASAELLAGHGGSQEATSFLSSPALPSPPGIAAQFASLFMPCANGEPSEFDEYCDGGLCTRIGCSGEGTGWHVTAWSEEPLENEGFAIETAEVVHAWAEGETATSVQVTYVAVGPDDRDWSFKGEGVLEADGLSLEYAFEAWVDGRPADMTWSLDPEGTTGEIVSGGVVVAALDETGHFVPTGDCPPPT